MENPGGDRHGDRSCSGTGWLEEMAVFMVCGEALMDVFAAGDTPGGLTLDARVGGSPFNVAVGLARLGQPVAFFGGVSSDFVGERLMRAFAEEGVRTELIVRSRAPTTLGLVGLDGSGVPTYTFYGEGAADRQVGLASIAALATPASPLRAIHVGSYATVVEPIASTLAALIEREHTRCVIAYDTNVRMNVEPDLLRWRARLDWMLPRTHVLKLSDEDVALLYPAQELEQLAARWRAHGVPLIVVTRGVRGAVGWCAAGRVEVAAPVCAVVDTVGAGDTFQAALLAGLAEAGLLDTAALARLTTAQLEPILRFASRAAAITCTRRGADLPRRAELT
jgi:fructokinase